MPSGSFHVLHCRVEWLWNLHTQLCLDRCLLPEPLFKEASMSRYPEWAAYHARTGMLLPRFRNRPAAPVAESRPAAART